MHMPIIDRYTHAQLQSQTRLQNSVTELNVYVATAHMHWRRGAANAHLAEVMGSSLRRHCRDRQSSSYSLTVRDSILADQVVASSLSTLG